GLRADQIILSCKMSGVQDLVSVYQALATRCDYPLHLGLTEAGMGTKGTVASTTALALLLQQGIGDTIRVSLTPQPGEARTQEVVIALEILQALGLRSFNPSVTACPGCGRTTSTTFQVLAKEIDDYLRAQMPVWKTRYPGVEKMKVAVMGCIVNGPGESKHADIGISLPGTGEAPAAPVFIDGETALFVRGLGAVTDIVEKEMYSFEDAMNGDRLTLRPEATAGIVRAMIEHNALYNGPLRVWSQVAVFRHERPQKGRYRQFHQIDVEALGHAGPDVDAEQILMCRSLLQDLGLVVGKDVRLEINSLGQPEERSAHRAGLIAYLEQHADALDEDSRRRLHTNPLRILDSKNPALHELLEGAPRLSEHLGAESLAHFAAVRRALDAA